MRKAAATLDMNWQNMPVGLTTQFLYKRGCKYEFGHWLSPTGVPMTKRGDPFVASTLFLLIKLVRAKKVKLPRAVTINQLLRLQKISVETEDRRQRRRHKGR